MITLSNVRSSEEWGGKERKISSYKAVGRAGGNVKVENKEDRFK